MLTDLHRDFFRLSLSCGLEPSCKVRMEQVEEEKGGEAVEQKGKGEVEEQEKRKQVHSRMLVFYSNDVLKIYP
jgi:hypothetical protein